MTTENLDAENLKKKKQEDRKRQKGQSMVEYLIILALVGVSSIAVMRSVGQNVKVEFAKVVKSLGGEVEGDVRAESVSKSMYQRSDLKNFMNGSIGKSTSGAGSSGGDSGESSGLGDSGN